MPDRPAHEDSQKGCLLVTQVVFLDVRSGEHGGGGTGFEGIPKGSEIGTRFCQSWVWKPSGATGGL